MRLRAGTAKPGEEKPQDVLISVHKSSQGEGRGCSQAFRPGAGAGSPPLEMFSDCLNVALGDQL